MGGAVRDLLRGQAPADYDWLAPDPEAAARAVASEHGGTAFPLDEARGFWRVVGPAGTEHDLTPVPAGGIEADLRRRDLTVNAMALTRAGQVLDPTGGQADLRARRLRAASPAAFREDTLRPLRLVRLGAELGWGPEPTTADLAREVAYNLVAGELPAPAAERAAAELERILRSERAAAGLRLLNSLGLLDFHLPELAEGRGIEQLGGFHHLDVLDHGIEALRRLVATFPDADLSTRWATLLHDVGKPRSRSWDSARERWSFFGHDRVGAEVARELLGRLRLPHARVERVAAMVDRHMLRLPGDERAARRFAHRHRALLPDLLRVMLADREAGRGPLVSERGRHGYQVGMSLVLAALERPPAARPLLDGRAIMSLLGLEPGPDVGRVVEALAEAAALGDATDEEEARRFVVGWARAQGVGAVAESGHGS